MMNRKAQGTPVPSLRLIAPLIALIIISTAIAGTSEVLVIDLSIAKNDSVQVLSVKLLEGSETTAIGTDYSIDLLNNAGEVIHTTYFDITFTAYGDNFPFLPGQEDVGVSVDLDEVETTIRVPYSTNAASFQVKKGTTILLEQDINLCNNDGTCQPANGENTLSCFADCPGGSDDDYCDELFDGVCDPDCGEQGRPDKDVDCTCGDGTCSAREDSVTCPEDCGAASNIITNLIYGVIGGGIAIIAAIIILIVLLVKRRKKGKKKK